MFGKSHLGTVSSAVLPVDVDMPRASHCAFLRHDAPLSENYKFSIPELRVGTLDSLMVLSDDLVKVNSLLESVVNKIRRQVSRTWLGLHRSSTRARISMSMLQTALDALQV